MATTESTPTPIAQDPEAELRDWHDSYLKLIAKGIPKVSARYGQTAARLFALLFWPRPHTDEQLAFILNISRAKVAGLRGQMMADDLIVRAEPVEDEGRQQ